MFAIPRPLVGEPARPESVLDVLRAAAECAGAGIDLLHAGAEPVSLATAPACNRCRRVTPAIHVRCCRDVRPRMAPGQSELCVHGQVLRLTVGGRLLAVAPAHRVSRFVDLLGGVVDLAGGAEGLPAFPAAAEEAEEAERLRRAA